MKNISLVLGLLFISLSTFSQDCEAYFPMEKGAVSEVTSYDKKDKPTGKTSQKVLKKSGSGNVIEAEIEAKNYDDKDKIVSTTTFVVKCDGGNFYFDMSSFLDQQQMAAYEGMEMSMDGGFLEFPTNMKAGDKLKDGHITVIIANSGMTIATIKVDITERLVDAIEEVTTSAGTFDCVKISYKSFTKIGFMKVTVSATEWFAKDVGMVKSETYNKKGKFLGKSLLTKFEK